jgi:hypothetical protein
MTDQRETATLQHAAELLSSAPWYWTVTVEYPGFLFVQISEGNDEPDAADDDDETTRYYAAGFANVTLTVDRHKTADGSEVLSSVDTHVRCAELDGYRMAVHVAAAIDRLEHE